MEKAKEILKKYLESEKFDELIKELNQQKIYFSGEENLDIRYSKLKSDMDEKSRLYEEAQKHIGKLNQSLKSGEDLKFKQTEYEKRISELKAENQNIRVQSALKQALIEAKVSDLDYLTYKVTNRFKNDNKNLELDETGKIKGLDEVIELEKKLSKKFFEPEVISKEVEVLNVGKGDNDAESEPQTLAQHKKAITFSCRCYRIFRRRQCFQKQLQNQWFFQRLKD